MKHSYLRAFVCCLLVFAMAFAIGCTATEQNKTEDNSQGQSQPADKTDGQKADAASNEEGENYVIRVACNKETYRAENLMKAAELLNEELKKEGSKDTVSVEYIQMDDYHGSMALWMQENNLPEIVVNTSIWKYYQTGAFVDASYVVNDEVYSEKVAQNLRDLAKNADGTYYAVIQDAECRFLIVYKPALVQLGWSEEQIEQWKQDARVGKVTTADLQSVAKQVVDAGICEYGILHRPNKGSDWRFTFITWNHGEIPVNEQGQVVISRQNIVDYLTYWRDNVQLGLTPYNHLTDFNWDMLEGDIWPNGKCFCWYGQVASKSDIMSAGGVTSEYVDENYFSIPLPVSKAGDTPASGSNPTFYGLSTSSQASEKMSEYCRRVLDLVLDPQIQLNSTLNVTHIAITDETSQLPEYQADVWMNDLTYINEYLFALPNNSYLDMYGNSQEMFDAIQQAELEASVDGAASIDEIVDSLIAKMTFNMGEGNYVLVD